MARGGGWMPTATAHASGETWGTWEAAPSCVMCVTAAALCSTKQLRMCSCCSVPRVSLQGSMPVQRIVAFCIECCSHGADGDAA
jgi:hypothetical protein